MTFWPAPAKINRFLHITGRRADGYHELQTLFQFVGRCDRIGLQVERNSTITLATPLPGVADSQHLAVRAARLLQQHSACRQGVTLHISKRLPLGGGLGGGSSDAASTLVGLNALWGTGLDQEDLAALGLRLGADVPVFVRGRAAWAEGVGERLSAVDDLDEPWFVVAVPAVTVSTAEVFGHPALPRHHSPVTRDDFAAGRTGNDCEAVVYAHWPEVAHAAAWLGQHATARLTGTGGCVFAGFASWQQARTVWRSRPHGLAAFVARGYNRSPLFEHPLLTS